MPGSLPRRTARALLHGKARPDRDLVVTRLPGSPLVYVGLMGAGYVKLSVERARQLRDELDALVATEPV